jgi:hypothetical protein
VALGGVAAGKPTLLMILRVGLHRRRGMGLDCRARQKLEHA